MDKRKLWLADYMKLEEDILEDEEGEYIVAETDKEIEDENGVPQGTGETKKIYLPDDLQGHE